MPALAEFTTVVIDCTDPSPLAEFYRTVTGREVTYRDKDSVHLGNGGPIQLGFQRVEGYRPPGWPDVAKHASVQVFAQGERHSRFVWIHDVLPDDLATPLGAAMAQGLTLIKHTLESQAARACQHANLQVVVDGPEFAVTATRVSGGVAMSGGVTNGPPPRSGHARPCRDHEQFVSGPGCAGLSGVGHLCSEIARGWQCS
jgi:hypothetical protein